VNASIPSLHVCQKGQGFEVESIEEVAEGISENASNDATPEIESSRRKSAVNASIPSLHVCQKGWRL
jgi:hypothetical protein